MTTQITKAKSSLGNKILIKMTLRISFVILCTCIFSYFHSMSIYDKETLEYAKQYTISRADIESEYFLNAETNANILRDAFYRKLESISDEDAQNRFNEIFEQRSDGVWNTKGKFADFKNYAGVAISPNNTLDSLFCRSMVASFEVVSQYGPAFYKRYYDTFMFMGKEAGIVYFPEEDLARLPNIKEILAGGFAATLGSIENSPDRKLYWTKIYKDEAIKKWMISVTIPIDYEGKWLGSAGHDVLIDDSLKRLEDISIPGTYNLIFSKNGELVVSKEFKTEIEKSGGQLDINQINDPNIKMIWENILRLNLNGDSVKSNAIEAYIGVKQISGPNWILVQIYPFSLIMKKAQFSILTIVLITLLSLLVELFIIYRILHKEVAVPLSELISTTENIYAEQSNLNISNTRNDELGILAKSIQNMALEVSENKRTLELKVQERTNELIQTNNVLKEKNTTLDILNQEKNEFISIANHDLKNPLSMVLLSLDLIKKKLDKTGNEKVFYRLDIIENQTIKMMEIISEYLNYILIEEDSSHAAKTIFNFTELIDTILMQNEMVIKNKSQRLIKKLDDEVMIKSSRNLCGVIFKNLLSNAIKFTEPNKEIKVELYQNSKSIFLRVSDEGQGIPKEEHHLVFQKFARLTPKPTGGETSSGLGLSVVLQLVEKLGAKISFESNPILGSQFTVEFPKE